MITTKFDVNVKHQPLLPGFYVIRGMQGVGKTSLAAALMRTDYRYHRRWRRDIAADQVRRYMHSGGKRLRLADHTYFSNLCIKLAGTDQEPETWLIEAHELALPNDEGFPFIYVPRGSVIHIQEADLQFACRDYRELSNYCISFLKFCRHNLLTIIFDVQEDSRLDLALRKLETDVFHVMELTQKHVFLWWGRRLVWRFEHFLPQILSAQKELAEIGIKRNLGSVRSETFRYRGNIFAAYNSFAGESYFLSGIEEDGRDFAFRRHASHDLSPESIEAYVAAHPLVKPLNARKDVRRKLYI